MNDESFLPAARRGKVGKGRLRRLGRGRVNVGSGQVSGSGAHRFAHFPTSISWRRRRVPRSLAGEKHRLDGTSCGHSGGKPGGNHPLTDAEGQRG